MKQRIDVNEVCLAYNNARDENKGKVGSPSWALEILKKKGLSVNLAKRILREPTLVIYSKRENAGKGNYKACTFPYSPIHRDWFQYWLYPPKKDNAPKKEQSFEEECAEYLRKQGYKLKKLVGFDENAFKKDYPQLYEKYLIYEEV